MIEFFRSPVYVRFKSGWRLFLAICFVMLLGAATWQIIQEISASEDYTIQPHEWQVDFVSLKIPVPLVKMKY